MSGLYLNENIVKFKSWKENEVAADFDVFSQYPLMVILGEVNVIMLTL